MIISLTAGSGSGKDTVADILYHDFKFVRFSWIDHLRRYLAINRFTDAPKHYFQPGYIEADKDYELKSGFLQALLDTPYQQSRHFRYRTGQEILSAKYRGDNVVITNSRRAAELTLTKVFGGKLLRIDCKNPRREQLVSDCWLDGWTGSWDYAIDNNGSLDELIAQVYSLMSANNISKPALKINYNAYSYPVAS